MVCYPVSWRCILRIWACRQARTKGKEARFWSISLPQLAHCLPTPWRSWQLLWPALQTNQQGLIQQSWPERHSAFEPLCGLYKSCNYGSMPGVSLAQSIQIKQWVGYHWMAKWFWIYVFIKHWHRQTSARPQYRPTTSSSKICRLSNLFHWFTDGKDYQQCWQTILCVHLHWS